MAQELKHILTKTWVWIVRAHVKKEGVAANACDLKSRGTRSEKIPGAYWQASLPEMQAHIQIETLFKKQGGEW